MPRTRLRRGLAACGFGIWAATAAAQTEAVSLDAQEVAVLAQATLAAGNLEQSRELAEALLTRDANDPTGLLVLAQIDFAQGNFRAARQSAARLYRIDTLTLRRYDAARLAALAAANEGRFTLAQWWLRRALIVADSDEQRANTQTDIQRVRQLNPWSTRVTLSFSPSDNVNGGADSEINSIDGVDFDTVITADGQALSGWYGLIDMRSTYTLAEESDQRTRLSFRGYARAVDLSGEAEAFLAANPRFDGSVATDSDFSNAFAEIGIIHDRSSEAGVLTLDATFGVAWEAGERNYNYLRLGAGRFVPLGESAALRYSAFVEERRMADAGRPDETRLGVQATYLGGIEGIGQYGLTFALGDTRTDAVNRANRNITLQAQFVPAEPFGPFEVSGSIGIRHSDYPDYFLFVPVPGGRQDTRVFLGLDISAPDFSYAGFAPVITIDTGYTQSNVSRFERSDFGIGLSLRSTF